MNFHQKPVTYTDEVGLKVLDLAGMKEFYQDIIGFQVISEQVSEVRLGTDGKSLIRLTAREGVEPKQDRYAGLYHFAILLPSRKELGKILLHLHQQGIRLGSSDHLVSEALYLSDPEGNGIEIYRDRDSEEWDWNNGEVAMAVDPIDAEGVVQEAALSNECWSGMPSGTVMGHVHLHVSNLDEAKEFYTDGLGFEIVTSMGGQALFLSDQKYHHHIGLNVWNGTGIPALPEQAAGLDFYTLVFADETKRSQTAERLRALGAEVTEAADYWETRDPSGNKIRMAV
ncbi:VOC family protein [Planomicrobium sp. MB-3u-38]|uniref:VOC family protein n=1 Tax=Planomicrobium sp. MB-3u-38 TaxID=2058318 RepID=UPI000C7AC9E1|nr:VOC family protein [Planomicrobium sp. MB-3u-38]PKH10863.1 glyoxalase [Planomicrobium sp. MB-3u-38]